MAKSLTPFLMFEGPAEAAMTLYASAFPGAAISDLVRYGPGELGPEGKIKGATLTVAGQRLRFFDSPVHHDFTFTPSISLYVECESEAELRRLAAALGDGGREYMPIGAYGFSTLFAWVGDQFGVTWQLNLT